jgi:hypothetical protein
MTWKSYQAAQALLEKKALGLMRHEKKDIVKIGFPIQFYTEYNIHGRTFYAPASNVFRHIVGKGFLLEAVNQYPEKFGTGEAYDVVKAIRLVEPTFGTKERHANFLQDEQFCVVMEYTDAGIADNVLRIDLFRHIKKNAAGNHEFIGGIFHAFKHFSFEGVNLSTGNDINDIATPQRIIELAIHAFYMPEHSEPTVKGFIGRISLDEHYWLKFSFYHERVNDVHFINTVHKVRKRKVTAS